MGYGLEHLVSMGRGLGQELVGLLSDADCTAMTTELGSPSPIPNFHSLLQQCVPSTTQFATERPPSL